MKILILGGSGILSTDFTKKALDQGDNVYLLNRGRRTKFIDERCNLIIADLRNESAEEIREKIAITDYDVVVDFLSFNIEQMKKTLAIIEGKYKQYIFISTATVYKKDNEDEIITEQTEIGNDKWGYAYNKSLCENYLKDSTVNYTIIRPYVTYGKSRIPFPIIPDGHHYTLLARIIEEKPVLLYEDGKAICTLTNTVDFAEVLYRLLLNSKAYREDFHITGPYTQSWKMVYEELCVLLNKKPNAFSVSIDDIKRFMPGYKEILLGDKGTNMLFDNSKVLNAIGGYDFRYDLRTGLERSVNYYLDNEFMQGIDYKWDGECDYLVYKLSGIKLSPVTMTKNAPNSKMLYYYIMRYQPFRFLIDMLRKIKHRN